MNTMQQVVSEATEYIDLEENEPTEKPEDSPRGLPKLSPRVSSPTYNLPPRSPVHSPGVDPVQQEIYDYIESLERK